ncbi:TetR/AcrR family transcriptional regulator [Halostreptopolyspora alba]|uniref:TetR/AcrR family transcriptional regulator n=1 Tax=Halostreptopolyspora alba TaxID=2487137 RepID=A0A3N0EGK8_9ACTN|nr:TetR/AcrR family transcriptional regulator [Nocardiopsaceae bacterium YIM 96095]
MPTQARKRLMGAAEELFYTEGIRAVGVERLLAASGVGRASFYRHFASKDDLVASMLREYDIRYREWLAERVTALGGDPLTVFDALAERSEWTGFRGCAFVNAMSEISDVDSEVHLIAAQHKNAVTNYIEELLIKAGYTDHSTLAAEFMLLIDGATATALRERNPGPALRAKTIAAHLLASHAPSPTQHPSP